MHTHQGGGKSIIGGMKEREDAGVLKVKGSTPREGGPRISKSSLSVNLIKQGTLISASGSIWISCPDFLQ